MAHAAQRRLQAEELIRLRRADEQRRYVASQRAGRIDPNPHQIDAVIFALQRIVDGGCILADEVGLGKTIEAGLVIAQLLSEGARRVLLIAPKPLIGQWREELFTLFGLHAQEARAERDALADDGIYVVGREAAGSPALSALIRHSEPFDLCVIDEAHELFANIHRRYDQNGIYREDSNHAKIAGRVKRAIAGAPVLLLTATPIQNSLTELWGLVQYVDPTGTLLGDLPTFRALFTDGSDRTLAAGAARELQNRLQQVVQRTLRRQAQEFMRKPFVGRRARTFEYQMSPAEKELYDDVSRYLLSPNLLAFRGSHRSLLLLGFHRRMASSKAALAASLKNVASRLERMLRAAEGGREDDGGATAQAFVDDLDDDDIAEALRAEERAEPVEVEQEAIRAELEHVKHLYERAESLQVDSKAQALLKAVRHTLEREREGKGQGKLVVFTESLTTQRYLEELLIESGLVKPHEITLFSGSNDHPRAREALEVWEQEVEAHTKGRARPSRSIAVRLALVHELRTRSRVFLSTEAGAKGLNLQFCDTLINYDLPWNPQRIEQRIGRIHRYGQTTDVTVINFLASDNAAQRLTYEILSQKLELFGTVLGASDEVLHRAASEPNDAVMSALATDFESQLAAIYRDARSLEEIEQSLARLRNDTESSKRSFEAEHSRTRSLIEGRLDEAVRRSFKQIEEGLPAELASLDRDLEAVVFGYLDAVDAPYQTNKDTILIEPCEDLPDEYREGASLTRGAGPSQSDQLHLSHPLVEAALFEARASTSTAQRVRIDRAPAQRGALRLFRLYFDGLEPAEELGVIAASFEDGKWEPINAAREILELPMESAELEPIQVDEELFDDLRQELLFVRQHAYSQREQDRFETGVGRLDRYLDDREIVLKRHRAVIEQRIATAQRARDAAFGAEVRTKAESRLKKISAELEEIDSRIEALQRREDETYQEQKRRLLDRRYAPPRIEVLMDLQWTRR